jgi:Cft2 family RNA processing exonuclease
LLVETEGRRLMIDLGYGPQAGLLPDVDEVGSVDALIVSHGHRDHVGGLSLLPKIGNPPVYATEIVAARLSGTRHVRMLPLCGRADVMGVPVATGRNGHAPGGVWLHLPIGGGLLYMGDYATESLLYAFDPPPRAGTVVIDASAGDDDTPLSARIAALAPLFATGRLLLPVPPDGRGPEIALYLARTRCSDLRLDDAMRGAILHCASGGRGSLRDGVAAELPAVAQAAGPIDGPRGVILAASADGTRGESARLIALWETAREPAIVFTGYLTPGTPAERLVAAGRAQSITWNVHPRLSENVALVRAVGAATVVAAFCEPRHLPALSDALAPARVIMDTPVIL